RHARKRPHTRWPSGHLDQLLHGGGAAPEAFARDGVGERLRMVLRDRAAVRGGRTLRRGLGGQLRHPPWGGIRPAGGDALGLLALLFVLGQGARRGRGGRRHGPLPEHLGTELGGGDPRRRFVARRFGVADRDLLERLGGRQVEARDVVAGRDTAPVVRLAA